MTFVELLKKHSRAKGFSQRRIGRELGVSTTAVHFWMTGRSEPTVQNVARLEQIFGLERGALLIPMAYPPSYQVVS